MISSQFWPLFSIIISIFAKTTNSFQCYTGDGKVLRKKNCPTLGDMHFTDLCFKTFGNGPETQRGCFNKVLLEIILQGDGKDVSDLEMGCHKFPEVYGQGTICVCDNSLCNSSPHSHFRPEGTWLMTTISVALAAALQRHLW